MRDPNRIDRVTKLLNKAWHYVPDFRFFQFISYLFEFMPEDVSKRDPFFHEENVVTDALKAMIEHYKKSYEEE